jgi:NitT/TauT family transport system substrate-binding protein
MQGWRDAMANPQEAAKLMHELVPTIPEQAITAELAIVQGLAVTPDVKANGFGTIDPKKFEKGVDFLEKHAGISGKLPKASDLYSTDYLPKPAIRP